MSNTTNSQGKYKLLKIGEAAKYIGVSIDTLRRWEKAGKIKTIKTPGGTRFYSTKELNKYVPEELLPQQAPIPSVDTYFETKSMQPQPPIIPIASATSYLISQKTVDAEPDFDTQEEPAFEVNTQVVQVEKPRSYMATSVMGILSFIMILSISSTILPIPFLKDSKLNLLNNDFSQLASISPKDEAQKGNALTSQAIAGSVLAASDSARLLQINANTDILGNLTAPNIIYSVNAGQNVSITPGQNPTISVNLPTLVSSVQGQTGAVTFTAGTDISISGLTIADTSTLSTVRGRGGCDSCITNNDIQHNLTINSDGNVAVGALNGTVPISKGGTNTTTLGSAGSVAYSDGSSYAFTSVGTAGFLLSSNGSGTPTWIDPSSISGVSYWQRNAGVLSPTNITDDLAIGGTATSSAKFQVFGNTGNTLIGGNLTFNSTLFTSLTGNGLTTNSNILTVNLVSNSTNSATINSQSGLEFKDGALSMLRGCANGQLLKWNDYTGTPANSWVCANDSGATSAVINVQENGVGVGTNIDTLNFGGSDFNVNASGSTDTITIDYANSGITRKSQNEQITGIWNFTNGVGVGTTTPIGLFNVSGAPPGKALATFDYTGTDQNIINASASGSTKFFISNTGNIGFAGSTSVVNTITSAATSARTYTFPDSTGTVCLTSGNCAGVAGIGGSGTTNFIPKFTTGTTIGNSAIFDNGNVAVGTTSPIGLFNVSGVAAGNATVVFNTTNNTNDLFTASAAGTTRFTIANNGTITTSLGAGVVHSNSSGVISSSQVTNADLQNSSITFAGDSGSGAVNLGGTLTIAGTSAQGISTSYSAGTVTVTAADAAYVQKGVASFNSTNFSVTTGAVNTIQNINSSAAPTFAGLTLTNFTTNGGLLYANGSGVLLQTGAGSSTQVLHGGTNPSYGAVVLTTDVSGTLPVGNGGTGTTTQFTQGSVVFAGASGVYSQNNSQFFFDNTNLALGIGTTTPLGKATITGQRAGQALTVLNYTGTDQNILTASTSGTTKFNINNNGNIGFAGTTNFINTLTSAATSAQTYTFPDATGTVCLTTGNCAGSGSGVTTPGGTTNFIAKFTGSQAIGNSSIFDNGNVAIGTTTPIGLFTVSGIAAGNATAVFNTGNAVNDLLTASSSGTTKFRIANNGNIGFFGNTSFQTTLTSAATTARTITFPDLDGTVCLSTSSGCVPGSTTYWQLNNGAISPFTNTVDVLIGATATTSAKFAFMNVNSGTPTASISANTANNYTYLSGAGVLGTTNAQTLTIGGAGTGDIAFAPGGATTRVTFLSSGNVGIGTTIAGKLLTVGASGQLTVDGTNGNLSTSGNITTTGSGTGTFAGLLSANGGLTVANGQATTLASFTSNGGVLYTNGSGVVAQVTAGSSTQVLHGGTTPSFGAVTLTTDVSGTLPVGNGGTGTNTTFTQGSVVFAGASGVYAQNNNEFFFDNTNLALGIGTTTPLGKFTVNGQRAGQALAILNYTGTDQNILSASVSGTTKFNISNTGNIGFAGNSNFINTLTTSATAAQTYTFPDATGIVCLSTGNCAGAGAGVTTPGGTTNFVAKFTGSQAIGNSSIFDNGNVAIGTTSPIGIFTVSGIAAGNATAVFNTGNAVNSLFTASASGTTKFTIANNGNIQFAGSTSFMNTLTSVATAARTYTLPDTTGTICLVEAGNCAGSGTGVTTPGGTANQIPKFTAAQSVANSVITDNNGNIGISSTSPLAKLDVEGVAGGNATAIFNTGNATNDLFTASSSGTTKFTLSNTGNISFTGNTNFLTTLTNAATANRTITFPDATGTICLNTNNCGFTTGTNWWTVASGALSPINSSLDLLIGGQATTSAKFAFKNVAGSLTPVASISATSTGTGLVLGGDGTIQSLQGGTLLFGGGTTGDIAFKPGLVSTPSLSLLSSGNVGIGTTIAGKLLTVGNSGQLTVDGANGNLSTSGNITTTGSGTGTFAGLLTASNAFTVSAGNITFSGLNSNNNSVLYTGASGVVAAATTTSTGSCLVSNGSGAAPSWGTCPGSTSDVFWSQANGALYANNSTVDLLIGGQASSSAKFAVLNVNSGTPTASVSAGTTGAAYITAAGTLSTTANQTLVLGTSTTGNITIKPGGSAIANFLTSGNVGIGTTLPTNVLQVSGIAGGNAAVAFNNAGSVGDIFAASASGTNKFVISNGGNVGIGSALPVARLDLGNNLNSRNVSIYDDGSNAWGQEINNNLSGMAGSFYSDVSYGAVDFIWRLKTYANRNTLTNAGTALFAITNGGNVGVGTSAPTNKFTVPGNVNFGLGAGLALRTDASYINISNTNGSSKRAGIQFYQNTTNLFEMGTDVAANNTNDFYIYDNVNSATRFYISSAGNIGLGTSSPTSSQGFTKFADLFSSGTDAAYRMHANGTAQETGIGTNGAGLYIDASGHATATNNVIIFRTEETSSQFSPTERMRIDSNGNIGIGTTGPTAQVQITNSSASKQGLILQAASSQTADLFQAQNSSGTILASLDANTNLIFNGTGTVTTSYANTFGTGDRTATMSISATGFSVDSGSVTSMIDGTTTNGTGYGLNGFNQAVNSGKYITFDFGTPQVITEMKLYQSSADNFSGDTKGTWQIQGSNDGSTYTNLGSTVTISGGNSTVTITTPSANNTPYRFYRFTGSSGTISTLSSNTWFLNEFEFKIVSSPLNYSIFASNGATIGSTDYTTKLFVNGFTTGKALAILNGDSNNNQDLFTASQAGTTKFTVSRTGNIALAGNTNFLTTLTSAATAAQTITLPDATGTVCLTTTCATGSSWWTANTATGVLYPVNNTLDLLIGGTATSSAKFAFKNVAGSLTPVASISGTPSSGTTNGLSLGGDGTIQSLNRNTLTLGGSTTGDITFSPGSSQSLTLRTGGNVGIGTTLPAGVLHVSGIAAGNATAIFNTANATNDLFTASSSGTNKFVINNNGNIGFFGSTTFQTTLTSAATAARTITFPDATGTVCLQNSANCGFSTGTNWWSVGSGALSPINNSLDLLIGGTATSSAKFEVLNMNSGTPVASISGNLIAYPLNGLGGNIGAGTTSPTAALDIVGAGKISAGLTLSSGASSTFTQTYTGSNTAATITANSISSNNVLALSGTNIGTGKVLNITGGSSMTSGNLINASGTFVLAAAGTGNAITIAPTESSTNTSTTVNAINIAPVLNTSGSNGANNLVGINFDPTLTTCGNSSQTTCSTTAYKYAPTSAITAKGNTTGLALDFNSNFTPVGGTNVTGIDIKTPAYALSSGGGGNVYGLNLSTAGAQNQAAGGGTINWYGVNINMPSSNTASGSISNQYGINIVGGTINASSNSLNYAILTDANAGPIGFGVVPSTTQYLAVVGAQPSSVSSGAGSNGRAVSITAAQGGVTTAASQTGGRGGSSTFAAGDGGGATGSTTRTGGAGGNVAINAGAGAASTGAVTTNTGGAGGNISITAGAGGNGSGATSNNGGNGGNIYISPGALGTGSTANGTNGNLFLGVNSSGTATGNVAIGTTTSLGYFNVTGAATGKALTLLNGVSNDQDLFTASQSGTTKFTITNTGNLALAGNTNFLTTITSAATAARTITLPDASGTICLTTTCASGTNWWSVNAGALSPINSSLDLLVGSTATTSAKFALTGIAGSLTPVASLSATPASGTTNGLSLSGAGTIQSLNMNTLTLGGSTTGNIVLNPLNGAAGGIIGPALDNVTDLGASSSARFRSLYLGPGSLHVQCTTGDGCGQGLDYALGVNTTTGTFSIGVNGTTATSNPLLNITQGGNIGIGTTTASKLLTVGTSGQLTVDGSNGDIVTSGNVGVSGNVGIGTTNLASAKLRVVGGSILIDNNRQIQAMNNAGSNGAALVSADTTDTVILGNNSTWTGISFQPGTAEKMKLTSTGNLGIGSSTPTSILSVSGIAGGNATAVFNTANAVNDLFTASSSGTTKFTIANNGNLQFAGSTSFLTTLTSAATAARTITLPDATGTLCLTSTCATGSNWWTADTTNGVLYPVNNTLDLLVGGTATTSAKFALTGIAGSLTPVASLSATPASGTTNGLSLSGAGTIQSLNRNTLTLGGATTGAITLVPSGSQKAVFNSTGLGIGTTIPANALDVSGGIVGAYNQTNTVLFGAKTGTSDTLATFTGDNASNYTNVLSLAQNSTDTETNSTLLLTSNTTTSNGNLSGGGSDSTRNLALSMTPSFIISGGSTLNATGIDNALSLSSINLSTTGNATANVYGNNNTLSGTPTYSGAVSGSEILNTYGSYNSLTVTPTLTTVRSGSQFNTYGGYFSNAAVSSGNANLASSAYGVYGATSGNLTTTGTTTHYGGYFDVSGSAVNNYGLYINGATGATTNYALYSNSAVANSYFAGNLGIGSTGPQGNLDIQSTASRKWAQMINGDGNQTLFTASVSGATKFAIDQNGFTTVSNASAANPGYQLYSTTNAAGGVALATVANGTGTVYGASINATGNGTNIGALFQATGGTTNYALLTSGGNVGIGTTTPNAFLDVQGSAGGNAAARIVQTSFNNNADIFTASQSSTTRFKIANNGDITATSAATLTDAYSFAANTVTTGKAFNINANALTTGTGFNLTSTTTSTSAFKLASLDWSPGSSTLGTGDLLSINMGANALGANFLNLKDNGTSVLSVSQTQFTTSLPTAFTAPGDISNAYDLLFTNPTASYIKSAAPLTIQSGELFNSSDLTLNTFNQGNIVMNPGNSVWISAGAGGNVGNAALIIDQTGTSGNDIFAASASGVQRVVIKNSGNVGIGSMAPAAKLDVSDSQTSTYSAFIRTTSTNANARALAVQLGSSVPTSNQRWIDFLGGNGAISGKIIANGAGSPSLSSTAGDYAEYFHKNNANESMPVGTLVCLMPNGKVTGCSNSNNNIIGVVSDSYIVLGKAQENPGSDQVVVGLLGQLPVFVSTENGAIQPGDLLTASSQPGVAMKATSSGYVIGKAQQAFNGSGTQKIDMLASAFYKTFDSTSVLSQLTVDPSGNVISTNGDGTFSINNNGNAVTTNLTANKIASASIDTGKLTARTITILSPDGATKVDLDVEGNDLVIKNAHGDTTISFDKETGSAYFSGEIVAKTIRAEKIEGLEVLTNQIADLTSEVASLSAQQATPSSSLAQTLLNNFLAQASDSSTLKLDSLTAVTNLTSIGQTLLSDTNIAGKLTVGTITIDDFENSINSIDTLKIQNSPLAGAVEFFGGALNLARNGDITTTGIVHAKEIKTQALTITNNQDATTSAVLSSSAGKLTIPAGFVTKDISTTALGANSLIFVTPIDSPVSVSAKKINSNTFRVTINQAQSQNIDINWWIVNTEVSP